MNRNVVILLAFVVALSGTIGWWIGNAQLETEMRRTRKPEPRPVTAYCGCMDHLENGRPPCESCNCDGLCPCRPDGTIKTK